MKVFGIALIGLIFVVPNLVFGQAPGNDNFVNRTTVSGSLPTTVPGTTVAATAEAGEPDHANSFFDNVASNSVWYQWTATVTGFVSIGTVGAGYDLAIGVYTGSTLSALTLVGGSDLLSSGDEAAVIDVTVGTVYMIAVDGFSPDVTVQEGTFGLNIFQYTAMPNDDFANATVLPSSIAIQVADAHTFGATAEAGEPNHASSIQGNVASNSIWYRWTAPADALIGVNVSIPSEAIYDHVISVYTGTSLEALTEVGSSDFFIDQPPERVIFDAVAGTEYRIALDGFSNGEITESGLFLLEIYEVPANDCLFFAEDLGVGLSATTIGTTANASYDIFGSGAEFFREPSPANSVGGNLASNTVWYFWTAPVAMEVRVEVVDVVFDPVLAVYTGFSLPELVEQASADVSVLGGSETLTFTAAAGTTYVIVVDAYSPNGFPAFGGTFTLNLGGSEPFEAWMAQFPSLTGDDSESDGNPSGDGVSNLLKLVLGLDPTIRLADDPNRSRFPELITAASGSLALRYTVAAANLGAGAQAISHAGQVSNDLTGWSDVAAVNTGGNTWEVEFQVENLESSFGRIIATIP